MTPRAWALVAAGAIAIFAVLRAAEREEQRVAVLEADSCDVWTELRGVIGWESPKIKRGPGDRIVVWAAGDINGPDAQWYDFTDSPIPAGELQYGIGRDMIASIDEPVFVDPDDPRLLSVRPSPYRWCERASTNDEIMVIGYVIDGEPRAYPTTLLDRHEVVNDVSPGEGKPFTVGW